jgi:predicted ATPase/class 3 adenylate cyclase
MHNRSETFGRLLKGAINSIAVYEGKTAPAIEEELGAQIGVTGGSIQRYKAGYLPPDPRTIAVFAEAGVRRGFLARPWLTRFLQAARHPNPDLLIAQLSDAVGETSLPLGERALPSGTLSFLFTDIEGSTTRWEQHPQAMEQALARHDTLLRQAIDAYGGLVIKTVGDAFQAVFTTVAAALEAALAAQHALQSEAWAVIGPLRVRMALHVGSAQQRDGDYFGHTLNRAARLCAAGHGGQVLLSNAAQELAHDTLPPGVVLRDLGAHQLKDLARREQIFQASRPGLLADFPPLRTLDRLTHNLPPQATPLIGREAEVAQASELLDEERVRLLTLTGPGGIGKTRLALQVAAERLERYRDGVVFVALASVSDPAQVPTIIAQALGLREQPGQPLIAQLQAALKSRSLLLVLDNFEQVIPAAPMVATLLATAPSVQVLVTSREALKLYGEQEYAVPPLTLPVPGRVLPLERLTQYEAVRLFIERAQAVRPDFPITAESAGLVAEICARLDGLPLAIELAAARSKLFPPRALLARLDQRLQLLRDGPRDLPARQQTLHNAIAWSYDLLDATEQVIFARLGVFVGGCTLEAAEAVIGDTGADDDILAAYVPQDAVLEGLSTLVDRSLLRQIEGADGEPRFVLLETIRAFARERLAASGEESLIRARHACWVRSLAEAADPQLRRPEQLAWYGRLRTEQANIRAALGWCFGAGDPATGAAIAAALWWYWLMQDAMGEGQDWLDQALDSGAGNEPIRAALLTGKGSLVAFHSGMAQPLAVTLVLEARAIWQRLGEAWWEAYCLFIAGQVELFTNADSGVAQALAEAGAALAQSTGDALACSYPELLLGLISSRRGDLAVGQTHYAAALAYGRTSGERIAIIEPLRCMARDSDAPLAQRIAWAEEALPLTEDMGVPTIAQWLLELLTILYGRAGRVDEAVNALDAGLAITREQGTLGHPHAFALMRGWVALHGSDPAAAYGWYHQGLTESIADACLVHQWFGLLGLAQVAARQGRHAEATTLFGAAERLAEAGFGRSGWVGFSRRDIVDGEAERAATRAALGEAAWAQAWMAGQALVPAEAVMVLGTNAAS